MRCELVGDRQWMLIKIGAQLGPRLRSMKSMSAAIGTDMVEKEGKTRISNGEALG